MIGSFLTRGLVMVFGYAYPAYECYKTVEQNKPEIEQLRFWCQYWILVAVLTVCERIGDAFVSWVPMYSEAKLAFFIYLWYPKTKGTTYVYDSFFRPYVAKHESEIDRSLLELKTRAGDMAFIYWQRAASYGQNRVFEILQYVASQSTPRPRPPPPQPRPESKKPPSPTSSTSSIQHQKESAEEPRPESKKPPSPTSSTSSSQHQKETAEAPPPAKTTNPQKSISATSVSRKANSAASVSQKANSANSASQKANSAASSAQKANASEITSQARPTEAEGMQIDQISYPANENSNPPPPPPTETVMEEYRVTRAISKRNRSAPNN